MKFKQFQTLKQRAYDAFAADRRLDVPEHDIASMDAIVLAFIGDAYYALYMRRCILRTGIQHVQVLHTLAAEFVSARAQAYVLRSLRDELSEEEALICRRARNAYSQAPKSATVGEYHDSTALEALVGYLVLAERQERLDVLMELVFEHTRNYCQERHGKTGSQS